MGFWGFDQMCWGQDDLVILKILQLVAMVTLGNLLELLTWCFASQIGLRIGCDYRLPHSIQWWLIIFPHILPCTWRYMIFSPYFHIFSLSMVITTGGIGKSPIQAVTRSNEEEFHAGGACAGPCCSSSWAAGDTDNAIHGVMPGLLMYL